MLYQSVPGGMPGTPDFTWILDPGRAGRVYPMDHFKVPAAAGSGPAARSTYSLIIISAVGGVNLVPLSGALALDLPGGRVAPWTWSSFLTLPMIPSESFSTTCVWWVART